MNQNKKHLYITRAVYPAEVGGPANTVYEAARVDKRITVLSSDRAMTEEMKSKYGIELNKYNNINGANVYVYKSFFNHPLSIGLISYLYKELKKFDFVHLHSFFAPSSFLSALLCLICKVKFIVHPHGELLGEALKFKKRFKRFSLFLYRKIYNRAHLFAVTSDDEQLSTRQFFRSQILSLPNTLKVNEVQESTVFGEYFLYLGRLAPIKNLELLIEAYDYYLKSNPNKLLPLRLVGAGDEVYVKSIEKLISDLKLEDSITIYSHVSGEEKAKTYVNCRAFFLVSKSENFGNVVMEALSHGRPVVTALSTPWEITEKLNCGLRVEHTKDDIRDAFNYFSCISLNDYRVMSINSRALALKEFDSVNVIPTFLDKVEAV